MHPFDIFSLFRGAPRLSKGSANPWGSSKDSSSGWAGQKFNPGTAFQGGKRPNVAGGSMHPDWASAGATGLGRGAAITSFQGHDSRNAVVAGHPSGPPWAGLHDRDPVAQWSGLETGLNKRPPFDLRHQAARFAAALRDAQPNSTGGHLTAYDQRRLELADAKTREARQRAELAAFAGRAGLDEGQAALLQAFPELWMRIFGPQLAGGPPRPGPEDDFVDQ
jgi:hypothetical protein